MPNLRERLKWETVETRIGSDCEKCEGGPVLRLVATYNDGDAQRILGASRCLACNAELIC